jgi:class 3 adenylate cyclase/predicted ATPase
MNVTEWLRGLGLEQYATAFRDNEIGERVLPSLTADDLKELGVNLIGHRRLLLDAIAALREAGPKQTASDLTAAPIRPAASSAEAERRQLTVMFCDIVGSTALSTQFDPEDLRELIGGYHRVVAGTVARFDGFVAKYMGDGVLIYFGYPQAHEDDAERSVRAGLAAIEAVSNLTGPVTLHVRIGIATGLAVVGDLIGAGASQERGVVGETPNLAARVQGLAEPNTIVIADGTRRQVGDLFDFVDLGPKSLAGFAEPQHAWRVVGESGVLSRFEALRSGTTPLIGRAEEIDLLSRRWGQAKTGEGRVVVLTGEPGIGKSRLTAALYDLTEGERHIRLRYFCAPHRQDSALYPVIVQLEHAASFERDDSPERKRAKLGDLLASNAHGSEDVALLGELLSIPGAAEVSGLSPQRKRERTFEVLLSQLAALSQRNPILLVFEDAHWADPTSRELLDRMVEHVTHLPILILVTGRPEFQHGWAGLPHVTLMVLSRLGGRDSAAMVERLAGGSGLSSGMIAEIVERSDGVPLFVEELTKAVLESAEPGGQVAAVLSATPQSALLVPATLHASLMARLDRLGRLAKEIAQAGAVLGREFPYDLVLSVAGRPEVELRAALDRLAGAGLVFCRGVVPNASYMFKHALVQDAAYGTLLRGRRQDLHGRAADALIAAGQAATTEPEIIAHHLQNAMRTVEAIDFWRKAGDTAARRSANREAAEHFRRALALVEAQPGSPERRRIELAVLSQLASPLMGAYGWSAPEVGDVVERAADVARRLESSAEIAPAVANLWFFNTARGRHDRAAEISADVMRMARETGDPDVLLEAHHCAWASNFNLGRFRASVEHIDAGAAIYDEARHARHRHQYMGHDPGVCLLSFNGPAQMLLGHLAQGLQSIEACVARARRLAHPPSLGIALFACCQFQVLRGDAAAVVGSAKELISVTDAQGLPMQRAFGLMFLGWGLCRFGDAKEGLAWQREGLQVMAGIGARIFLTMFDGLLADSLLAAGKYSEGVAVATQAFDTFAQTGDRSFLSRLHRLRGELLLHANGSADEEGEQELRQALSVARDQDAKGFELGAATSLARLLGERGRRTEAYDLLAPIYGWFTEGFDTADLKAAKVLLEELV